uniref:glucuronosyltransferase n=1 Tax=Meloidogyne incognita TaxID=6306 RepID=A0A914NTC6_MELIC
MAGHSIRDNTVILQALYRGVPLILIPFTFDQKFNAKIAEYMKVGTVVDHTKFVEEFPLAVNELIGENQELNADTLIGNANKIKEVIHQFSNGQIKTFLETVEKAIEGKDEEEPFPEMPTKFKEIKQGKVKPFSVVLDEFINSKQN